MIGAYIQAIISKADRASVLGLTSKGIYLLVDNENVAFITTESYASPLTINIDSFQNLRTELIIGDTIGILRGEIIFYRTGVKITTTAAKRWHPPKPSLIPNEFHTIQKRIDSLISELEPESSKSSLFEEVKLLVRTGDHHQTSELFQKFQELDLALSSRNTEKSLKAILPFLGQGQGLTPSGDDFICGLLIALNRWKSLLGFGINLNQLNNQVIAKAREKTTTLSHNLIMLASKGFSDGRIVNITDYLVSGLRNSPSPVSDLLTYGSSSSLDTLAGILIVLSRVKV